MRPPVLDAAHLVATSVACLALGLSPADAAAAAGRSRPLPGLHLPRTVSDQTLDTGFVDLPARVRTLRTRMSPPEALRVIVEHLDLRGWQSSPGQPGLRPETKDGAFRLSAFPAGAGPADAAWFEALGAGGGQAPVFIEVLPESSGREAIVNITQGTRAHRMSPRDRRVQRLPRCAGCTQDAAVDLGFAVAVLQSGEGNVARGEALAVDAFERAGYPLAVTPSGDAGARRFIAEGTRGACSVSVQAAAGGARFLIAAVCDKSPTRGAAP